MILQLCYFCDVPTESPAPMYARLRDNRMNLRSQVITSIESNSFNGYDSVRHRNPFQRSIMIEIKCLNYTNGLIND